jgi:rare lipoprotein A
MGDLGAHGAFYRFARLAALGAGCLALANCSTSVSRIDPKYGVTASERVVPIGERAPKGGGVYKVGKAYTVAGRTYVPKTDARDYHAVGLASWYGDDFHGRYTANGEIFDEQSISAASPVLPLPSYARVTNLANHRSIVVRVNDRGPYAKNRILDVSRKTAKLLGFYDHGVTKVRVDYVGRAPLSGSSDRELIASLRHHTPDDAKLVKVAFNEGYKRTYFDSRPLRGVLPPDRPFGQDSDRSQAAAETEPPATSAPTTELAAAAKPERALDGRVPLPPAEPQMAQVAERTPNQVATAHVSPVSAYAPMGYDGHAAGFMSGRGLY